MEGWAGRTGSTGGTVISLTASRSVSSRVEGPAAVPARARVASMAPSMVTDVCALVAAYAAATAISGLKLGVGQGVLFAAALLLWLVAMHASGSYAPAPLGDLRMVPGLGRIVIAAAV